MEVVGLKLCSAPEENVEFARAELDGSGRKSGERGWVFGWDGKQK